MPSFTQQTFVKDRIVLDNNDFTDCTFSGCNLVYAGGSPPNLKGCVFKDATEFTFDGPAGNTLGFLRALSSNPGTAQIIRLSFPSLFGS